MVLLYYSAWFTFFYQSLRLNITQAMVAFPKTRWVTLILNRSLNLESASLRTSLLLDLDPRTSCFDLHQQWT